MASYFLKRLLGLLPTLLIVAVLVFLFVHMLPGDPARLAAGPDADPQTVALVRPDLGLDKPLPQQFVDFFAHMLHGDFGHSLRSKRPVSTEIAERFMPTLLLTLASMVWSVLFGMAIGIVLGGVPQPVARPARHDAGRVGHLVPGVRARHAADGDLLGAAGLAAHRGRRQLAPLHPAVASRSAPASPP